LHRRRTAYLLDVNNATEIVTMETVKNIALTATFGLLAFAMFGAGFAKLSADPMMVTNFVDIWGYGLGFMYFTGATEWVAAALLVLSKTRFYGAMLAGATMVGAIGTHLMAAEFGGVAVPLFLGSLAAVTAYNNVPEALTGTAGTPAPQA